MSFSFLTKYSDGNIEVDVIVGVLNKTIEDLKFKLTGLNNFDLMLPTISTQIGYLMPEKNYKNWNFIENNDNTKVINDLLYSACLKSGLRSTALSKSVIASSYCLRFA